MVEWYVKWLRLVFLVVVGYGWRAAEELHGGLFGLVWLVSCLVMFDVVDRVMEWWYSRYGRD